MRRLTLRKETLSEIGDGALRGVVGGTHLTCRLTDNCSHGCATVDNPCASVQATCPSVPVTGCTTVITTIIAPTVVCIETS